jgi:CheY-like chemotaxis protein
MLLAYCLDSTKIVIKFANNDSMIRVLLVDDQSIVREGLASLLQAKPDIEVVGEAENGRIAIEKSLSLRRVQLF